MCTYFLPVEPVEGGTEHIGVMGCVAGCVWICDCVCDSQPGWCVCHHKTTGMTFAMLCATELV